MWAKGGVAPRDFHAYRQESVASWQSVLVWLVWAGTRPFSPTEITAKMGASSISNTSPRIVVHHLGQFRFAKHYRPAEPDTNYPSQQSLLLRHRTSSRTDWGSALQSGSSFHLGRRNTVD